MMHARRPRALQAPRTPTQDFESVIASYQLEYRIASSMVMIERALIAGATRRRTMLVEFDGACAVHAGEAPRSGSLQRCGETRYDLWPPRALCLTESTK